MKEKTKQQNELVTKGYLRDYLRYSFGRFHTQIRREIKEESHALEFRMSQRFDSIDQKIDAQNQKLDSTIHVIQQLADQVIGEHRKFEIESVSIKFNYGQLEERVENVEKVVFPFQHN